MSKRRFAVTLTLFAFSAITACAVTATAQSGTSPLQIVKEPNALVFDWGDHPMLSYRFNEVPFKPYAQTFYTPSGINILRDAPHDHLHHHALMYAIGVNGVSFWAETPGCGTQEHLDFAETGVATIADMSWAGFVEQLQWRFADKSAALTERRTLRTTRNEALNASLVLWDSELSVPAGGTSVKLTGDHYYGLGMRFLESMDKGGEFITATGKFGDVVRGDERLSPADWCAYTAEADGKPVTVAMFDCPANPRYPALWFTMQTPFAYLSATRNLWKEPMELNAGSKLTFRHAIALWDGKIPTDTIEKMRTLLGEIWK